MKVEIAANFDHARCAPGCLLHHLFDSLDTLDPILQDYDKVLQLMIDSGHRPAKGDVFNISISDPREKGLWSRLCARVWYVQFADEDGPFYTVHFDLIWWDDDWSGLDD